MKIEEAIKYLGELRDGIEFEEMPEHFNAANLGIEALKGIMKVRKTFRPYVEALLPGETED